jgi:Ca2+-binding RTX toxin-like protein
MGWLIRRFPSPTPSQLASALSFLSSNAQQRNKLKADTYAFGNPLSKSFDIFKYNTALTGIKNLDNRFQSQMLSVPIWEDSGKKQYSMLYYQYISEDPNFAAFYAKVGNGTKANDSYMLDSKWSDYVINTHEGNDVVTVGSGGHRIFVNLGAGDDSFNGGAGSDGAFGSVGKDVLRGGGGFDVLDGGADDDQVFGDDGTDMISGGTGNDFLNGGTGEDLIDGGEGNDVVIGGAEADVLTGLGGVDTFRYNALSDSRLASFDKLTDFAIGSDILDGQTAVTAANTKELGAVATFNQAGISAVLTTTVFGANQAATFTFGSGLTARTFLALNNGTAGFSSSTDSLIEITGYSGLLTNLSII